MKTRQYNSQGLIIRGMAEILMICSFLFLYGFPAMRSNAQGRNADQTNRSIQRVRQIYTSQIGAREKQANSGAEVKKYLRYVGLPSGHAWCAAFVCWVYGEAGIANPKSAWSPDLFKPGKVLWGPSNKYQVSGIKYAHSDIKYKAWHSTMYRSPLTTSNEQPTTGDIFAIWFPDKKRIAHTGFIDSWGDSWLITVEGNTNLNGSREGDGVYRKRRMVKSIYQVARYIPGIRI